MRSISRAIDRFCYNHPGFGIPYLMRVIVFGTAAVFLFDLMGQTNGVYLSSLLAFSPALVLSGQIWRIFTFVFIPTNYSIWLIIVLYMYYMIGTTLEQQWGRAKFNLYYLISMILSVAVSLIMYLFGVSGTGVYVSSYYINLSLFFAFATLYPDIQFLIFFIIPIKAKWIGIISALLLLWDVLSGLFSSFPATLMPLVTLITYFIFCGEQLLDYIGVGRRRSSSSTINFKRAAKKINREQRNKPYTRKCSVCGKTDTDYPDLEFRYCSRCEGYHCFCIDHINNHVHFDK